MRIYFIFYSISNEMSQVKFALIKRKQAIIHQI